MLFFPQQLLHLRPIIVWSGTDNWSEPRPRIFRPCTSAFPGPRFNQHQHKMSRIRSDVWIWFRCLFRMVSTSRLRRSSAQKGSLKTCWLKDGNINSADAFLPFFPWLLSPLSWAPTSTSSWGSSGKVFSSPEKELVQYNQILPIVPQLES